MYARKIWKSNSKDRYENQFTEILDPAQDF